MGTGYRPPTTAWDARRWLADNILAAHAPREAPSRLGRLWVKLRGRRCAEKSCGRRWPCHHVTWAREQGAQ